MIPPEFDIRGRKVVITGASRGIGKGIARVPAEAGAQVLVTALTGKYLKPLAQEMAAAGHPIETLAADATKALDMEETVQKDLGLWGHIDAFINNLGDSINKPIVPLPGSSDATPLSDDEWRFIINVNLTEAFLGCRTVGPHFLER